MAAQSMRQSGQQFLHSVRFKLTIAVTIVLTLILGLSAAWRYERHCVMDMEEAQAQAKVANGLIVASLQHAMMTHDPADIQSIIDNVSHQAGVRGMYLYNADGAVKWYGEQPPSSMAADPKGGAVPTAKQPKLPAGNSGSAFTAAVTGEQVLRQWNVIENQPRCNGCHSAQAAMLGTLVADYSITETNRQIAMDLRAVLPAYWSLCSPSCSP